MQKVSLLSKFLKHYYIMTSSSLPSDKIIVYSDGSCRNNKCGIGVYFPGNALFPTEELSECVQHHRTTNQVAELTACIRAIEVAKQKKVKSLLIRSDSAYVVNSMKDWVHKWKTNNWKKSGSNAIIENLDLVKKLDELCQTIDVEWEHVPRKENKIANRLSQQMTKP